MFLKNMISKFRRVILIITFVFFKILNRNISYENFLKTVDLIIKNSFFNKIITSISIKGNLFYFNIKRLSLDQLKTLFEKIDDNDSYFINKIKNNATIIDIGTHIGAVPFVASLKLKNATFYCVEPDKENLELAKLNLIQMNDLKRNNKYFFYDNAIGFKSGNLDFYVSNKVDWRSSVVNYDQFNSKDLISKNEFSSTYKVKCITLNSFLNSIKIKNVDLLKITIPGEIENKIIKGCYERIKFLSPKLIAIFTYKSNRDEIEDLFLRLNYVEITKNKINDFGSVLVFEKK